MSTTADNAALVFMAFNVAFLMVTVVMFRRKSLPSNQERYFYSLERETILEDLQWQYSLRSNLLLAVVVLTSYLIYLREVGFLLFCFTGLSVMNVSTDWFLVYNAPGHKIAVTGHRIAGVIILLVTFLWWLSTKNSN